MDKPAIKLIIVGAGGVATYLVGPLVRSFNVQKMVIVDKDEIEERNLDRQFFLPSDVGESKAEVLISYAADYNLTESEEEMDYRPICAWFTGPGCLDEDDEMSCQVIICCADNHEARRNVLGYADHMQMPAIIGGNELFDNEAYLYLPAWKDTPKDPRVRHPELLTDNTGSPLHCQQEQEIHPQLATANFSCAAKILSLLWRLKTVGRDRLDKMPFELSETLYEATSQ